MNAVKNLWRNRGRCLLAGFIIMAVLTAAAVVMLLKEAAGEWITGYRNGFGVETGITTDWEYAQEHYVTEELTRPDGTVETASYFEADPVSMKELESYADSELVKKAVLSGNVRFASDSLKAVELGEGFIILDGMSPEELCKVYGVEDESELKYFMSEKELNDIYSFKRDTVGMIYGYTDPSYIREFGNGMKKIVDGRFFENPGEAVIGDEFAELNGLHVGDRIRVTGGKKGENKEKELTVAGIFTNLYANANQSDVWVGFSKNDIIVGYDTFTSLGFEGVNPFMDEIKYFVGDPSMMTDFEHEVRQKGLPECYKLQYDVSGYENIVGPVEKAAAFAGDFGKIVLLAGACILAVLTVINVRDRKYEIGVLRAIGMPRLKVALGLIIETVIIAAAAAVSGCVLGSVLIKPVLRLAVPGNDALSACAKASFTGIMPVFASAMILAFISGAVSAAFVMRYEPMRIFRQAD